MLSILLQVCGGWVYGHFFEYAVHRWALHGPGRRKGKLLSFHFTKHHKNARLNQFEDHDYDHPFEWGNGANKELVSLALIACLHVPLVFYLPWFFGMTMFSLCSYYYHHRKSHKNPMWARIKIPWHWDHHMGKNQNLNFGIRSNFFDKLLGTHEDYAAEGKAQLESLLRLRAKLHRRRNK